MNTRTPLSSKKPMPKPSLCSSARVAKPVKLNITSVGVLAFMPRSWHMRALRSRAEFGRQYGRADCTRLAATMQASPASRASPMDLRQALFEVAAEHRLDAAGVRRLEQLAGLDGEPVALPTLVPRGIAVLAAALGGLGIVFWIAANWQTLGRFGRFALLE